MLIDIDLISFQVPKILKIHIFPWAVTSADGMNYLPKATCLARGHLPCIAPAPPDPGFAIPICHLR